MSIMSQIIGVLNVQRCKRMVPIYFDVEDCGRNYVVDQEGKRRRKSFKYKFALEQLSREGIRHRTCGSSIFDNYLESMGSTLRAMKLEKMRLSRKKLSWLRKRKTRSTLDKIADELLLGTNKNKRKYMKLESYFLVEETGHLKKVVRLFQENH